VCLALWAGRAPAQQAGLAPPLPYSSPRPAVAVPYPPPASLAAPRAAAPETDVRQTALQQPPGGLAGAPGTGTAEETTAYRISLEPPGPNKLFKLESEQNFFERIRQDGRNESPPDIAVFPTEPVLSRTPYMGRRWPAASETTEANYLCYRRLLYEQKNFERGGWDLGAVTPLVSALDFYKDVVLMPYHGFTDVCRCYECNTGYCLPGDPVPLLLYPPEPSVTGALAEAAVVAGVFAIFP
jgi:hypothetical protein